MKAWQIQVVSSSGKPILPARRPETESSATGTESMATAAESMAITAESTASATEIDRGRYGSRSVRAG